MTLTNINAKQRGFTIVELLIVIVVIAILAAITIVAYNGIQNRARATQYAADANGIVKVAEAINAREDGAGYPTTVADGLFEAPGGGSTADVTMPNNVRVEIVAAAPTTNNTEATGSPEIASDGTKTYKVQLCTDDKGLRVYYADPTQPATDATKVKSSVAGTC